MPDGELGWALLVMPLSPRVAVKGSVRPSATLWKCDEWKERLLLISCLDRVHVNAPCVKKAKEKRPKISREEKQFVS